MEHLDREMDLLNQQRIRVGPTTQEGQRLTQIKQSSAQTVEPHQRTEHQWLQQLVATPAACLTLEWG